MTYEEFDAMLEREGNALVKQLAYEIAADQLTIPQAARKAAQWHVQKIRKRHGQRFPALHYQALYEDLYRTGLNDFPAMVHNIKLKRPPFDPSHKPIETILKGESQCQ